LTRTLGAACHLMGSKAIHRPLKRQHTLLITCIKQCVALGPSQSVEAELGGQTQAISSHQKEGIALRYATILMRRDVLANQRTMVAMK